MEQTVDSLLASLAGMGFELEQCQAAVNAGKLTVQDAVDWLLQGGGSDDIATRATPSLSLRQQNTITQETEPTPTSDSSNLPFSHPPVPIPDQPPLSPTSPVSPTPPSAAPVHPSSSPDVSSNVVSRYNLTEEKKKDQARREREEREKAQADAKAKRRQEKQAKIQILREIEADREARRMKSGKAKTSSAEQNTEQTAEVVEPPSGQQSSKQQMAATNPPAAEVSATAVSQTCTLQIRLPSGQSLREKFDASATLQVVKDQVCQNQPDLPGISFMQPFPHRLFIEADLSSTLAQLQLTPSGCLVVRSDSQGPPNKIQRSEVDPSPPESQPPVVSPPTAAPTPGDHRPLPPRELPPGMFPAGGGIRPVVPGYNAQGRIAPMGFMRPPRRHMSPPIEQPAAEPMHSWGRGNVLDGTAEGVQGGGGREQEGGGEQPQVELEQEEEEEDMEGQVAGAVVEDAEMEGGGHGSDEDHDDDSDDDDDDDDDDVVAGIHGINQPWGGLPRRRAGDWNRQAAHFAFDEGARRDWGGGNRLGGDPLNFEYGFGGDQRRPEHQPGGEPAELPDRQRAAAAALQRLAVQPKPSSSQQTRSNLDKPVTSLLRTCLRCITKRFERLQHPVTAMDALPPQLALSLIDELKTAGVLRPKTLQMFLPCHLQHLSLDSYKYTTNELVQTLRYHTSLTRLSLSACPLITDQAVTVITYLKKLQHINLSNNKKLTDSVCHSLTKLPNLITAVLEGTGVTDRGVEVLSSNSPQQLNNLNLSRTTVSDAVFLILAGFPNLKNLGLEATKVRSLDNLEHLTSLRTLNIARNHIMQEGLERVKRLPSLVALNISRLEGLSGDDALRCIQGMELVQLQLPDRHTTTDQGLRCIAGMPLTGLDLTDFIHITDEGVHHLADMTSLRKLSLNNTKITDTAMTYIQGLTFLEELHLDRTAISDEGAKILGSFVKLQALSMSATQITNRLFISSVLNACVRLTRLNLSRATISNEGILALRLPYLALINLDKTCVSEDVATLLRPTCPALKVVRNSGLRSPREAEMD